jgi:hypothetical protein
LALLAVPGSAAARPKIVPINPTGEICPVAHVVLNVSYSCASEFTLNGSNGYQITVSGDPGSHGSGEVEISVGGRGAGASLDGVSYSAPGTVTRTGMSASFGRLGKVSLRFRPIGKVRRVRVPKKCAKGHPPVVEAQLGSYSGTIRFRGERGYTTLLAHHARGGLGDPLAIAPKTSCEKPESKGVERQEAHAVHLEASAKGVAFGAWAGPAWPFSGSSHGSHPYTFLVFAAEEKEGMRIFRFLAEPGDAGAFVFDNALTSATIAPPLPFTGSASFRRGAGGSNAWAGTLAVPMPGLGSVPLTGPAFKSELADHLVLPEPQGTS